MGFIVSTPKANRSWRDQPGGGGLKKIAPVAVRINPNVDAAHAPKITTGTYENKLASRWSRSRGLCARGEIEETCAGAGADAHRLALTECSPLRRR